MNYQTLAKILKYAGVHRYVPPGPVFVSDGTMAVVQTSKEKLLAGSGGGTRKLSLPEAGDVWDYFENKWYTGISSVDVTMKDNSTKIFFMGNQAEIEAMNIPEFRHAD